MNSVRPRGEIHEAADADVREGAPMSPLIPLAAHILDNRVVSPKT